MTSGSSKQAAAKKIPLGQPVFGPEEPLAVQEVFKQAWVLNGPTVRAFEKQFAQAVGVPFAAAVSSCTAGMHLALAAYDFPAGSEVLLPAFNFVADGLSVLQAGLVPVFVDVNPRTANMDVEDLARKVTPKSKAILALHYAGWPCAMDRVMELAKKNGLKVVEDASHALGSAYGGKRIGAIGDVTSFSFGPLKMICTGMGGMVTTADAKLNARISSDRSYGMDKSMWNRKDSDRPWSYSVQHLGHNFRMTDYQAAMGIEQMKKLERFIAIRKQLSEHYDRLLGPMKAFDFFQAEPKAEPVPLYYAAKLKDPALRDPLAMFLVEQGIGASVHCDPPLHVHPLYEKFGYKEGQFPATEKLAKAILSLPLYPAMTTQDVDRIAETIDSFLKGKH